MDTGSDLSIYTNIFGWYYYDLFIQLISSYGLWIIGFLFLLWQATFVLASRNGRYDPRSSLLNAEYNIYLMLFILVFAVIPSISVNASFFHNNGKAAGATGSSFDALNSTSLCKRGCVKGVGDKWFSFVTDPFYAHGELLRTSFIVSSTACPNADIFHLHFLRQHCRW